jgi:hypothetical protein
MSTFALNRPSGFELLTLAWIRWRFLSTSFLRSFRSSSERD